MQESNTVKKFILLLLALLLFPVIANARVTVPEKAVYSMGFGNISPYCDGCKWAGISVTSEEAIRSYYLAIKEGVEAGVDAFGLDITSNNDAQTTKAGWLASAMKQYNSENPANKKCIFVMYEAESGSLGAFNAADLNGASDSPYCQIDNKPVVGAWNSQACINPLPGLTGKGPFVMVGTEAFAPGENNVASQDCVNEWKNSGASRVLNFLWISGNMNLVKDSNRNASKAAAIANGSEFMMGIPSSRTEQCGTDVCEGAKQSFYRLRDGNGFQAALMALRAPINDTSINKMMFTMGFPGDLGEDSSWSKSEICDEYDTLNHNITIGGVNPGFTCHNVPSHMRGTVPTQNSYKSYGNKSFSKAGFWRIAKMWAQIWKEGKDPISEPFIAFSYREHPFALNSSGFDICPNADATTDDNSLSNGITPGTDNLYITSYSVSPIKLRVKIGGSIVGTYTLPPRQAMLDSNDRQTVIPFGTKRGRPTFEVLNDAGTVIATKEGEVEYTNTPKQRDGKLGRNYSLYAGYMDLASSPTTQTSYKCGCKDTNCTTRSWAIQGVKSTHSDGTGGGGTSPYETGGQCSASLVPTQAAEKGLTYLAFCDDFSKQSINVANNWNTVGDPSTTNERWSTFVGSGQTTSHMTGASLSWNTDGTVIINPDWEDQELFMSTMGKNGDGYFINNKKRYYAEVRWKFNKLTGGHPNFMSMDRCHTAGLGTCENNLFIEPDYWEFANGTTSTHLWKHSPETKWSRCNRTNPDFTVPLNTWFTAGALYYDGNTDAATQKYYKDDNLMYTRTTNTGGCTDLGGGTSSSFIKDIGSGEFPILLGAKYNDILTLDYVRVWEHPDDQ